MTDYVILTDSSSDLPPDLRDRLGVVSVPLSLTINDGTQELTCPDDGIAPEKFYQMMRGGAAPQTGAPGVEAFCSAMEPVLQAGKDILCLSFSSGLSMTYNSACMATEELRERYPQRKLYTVDTLCASLGQGLLLSLVCAQKQKGSDIDQARDFAEQIKLRICHWFTVEDLVYLKRGGRISATAALLGTLLSIKPVLHVDNAGKLVPVSKVRGRKASIAAMAEQVRQSGDQSMEQTLFISHGDCREDAEYLAACLSDCKWITDVVIGYVGPVVGSHSGPGTLAVFFVGNER